MSLFIWSQNFHVSSELLADMDSVVKKLRVLIYATQCESKNSCSLRCRVLSVLVATTCARRQNDTESTRRRHTRWSFALRLAPRCTWQQKFHFTINHFHPPPPAPCRREPSSHVAPLVLAHRALCTSESISSAPAAWRLQEENRSGRLSSAKSNKCGERFANS